METKKEIIKSRRIRARVKATQAFMGLSKAQQIIASTGQNVTAIFKGLEVVSTHGVLHWETFSHNSVPNAEIIRELYVNSLEVKF